jgi:uncharacterized membrane protein YgdD (TMEM256/DUF423 family)
MNHRLPLVAAGLLGATGVAFGAFGAHALRPFLLERGTLEVWETGVHYHLLHAVALLGAASWMRGERAPVVMRRCAWVVWCWIAGVLFFSGSLYLLAAGAPRWVGPITPVGGLSLILGWVWLLAAGWSSGAASGDPR